MYVSFLYSAIMIGCLIANFGIDNRLSTTNDCYCCGGAIPIQWIEGIEIVPQSWYWFVLAGSVLVVDVDACTILPEQDHACNELVHGNVHVPTQRIPGTENVPANKQHENPK
jgi:hypothetical protein